MRPIATECTLYRSPDPQGIFCYTPFLARGFGGRLLASFDLGGKGVGKLPGPKSDYGDFRLGNQTKIFLSDDHGKSRRPTSECFTPESFAPAGGSTCSVTAVEC